MRPTTFTALAVAGALTAATPSGCTGHARTPTPVAAPAADITGALAALDRLQVAREDTGAPYRRADWPHWSLVGGECDAREDTLKRQGHHVTTGAHCAVTGGNWTSPYDGVTVTNPGELDIDHLVPLAEVARSGTRTWTHAQRERYANDPAVLVAVTAKANRSKGDQDPARWLPALDRCGYAAHWVAVKTTYGMTVDTAERSALVSILRHC